MTYTFDVDGLISLDKRWNYYAYPWEKHRRTCLRIKFAEVRVTVHVLRMILNHSTGGKVAKGGCTQ